MTKESLRIILFFFTIFLIVQALSGISLFVVKIGYNPAHIAEYFLGSEDEFIKAKSFWGLLEVAVPHLVGISIYILVMGHFLFLFPLKKGLIVSVTYLASLGDVLSGFLIRYGGAFFSPFKILFFVLFELTICYFIGMLVIALFQDKFFPDRV
ncbi:MAG: hypothetical protein A3G93_16890 [Nitrospinae bacterium RIFCSPLOWO2_12_FULL_45_22]|nr:MAG: hypothetical protein A3G93_16890 [Nitrospinae bacterium RIFCSPLOWO2_12_FULL_45_22]